MESEEVYTPPSMTDKMMVQMKRHPLIPLGMAATVGALSIAFRRMQQRDSIGYQRWLRARVVAQGFTIGAIVLAGVQEMRANDSPAAATQGTQKAAELAERERKGFEERMKAAEAAFALEEEAKR